MMPLIAGRAAAPWIPRAAVNVWPLWHRPNLGAGSKLGSEIRQAAHIRREQSAPDFLPTHRSGLNATSFSGLPRTPFFAQEAFDIAQGIFAAELQDTRNPVWSENSTRSCRRPFSGLSVGCGTRHCAAGPAFVRLRSTQLGPFISDISERHEETWAPPGVCAASALMSRHELANLCSSHNDRR